MKSEFLIIPVLIIIIAAGIYLVKGSPARTPLQGATAGSLTDLAGDYEAQTPPTNAVTAKPAESKAAGKSIIIDHTSIKLDRIPLEWIEKAKKDLHIAFGHTSHGSQITTGLTGLTEF